MRGRSRISSTSPRRACARCTRSASLAFGAPTSPGVYLFRDRARQVLYVGRARDLRARLRSYFRTDRQRPAVEAALCGARANRVARDAAPSSRRRSRSCGCCASCARRRTRATRGPTATSISAAAATSSSARRRRRRSARCAAARARGSPAARSTAVGRRARAIRRSRCRACAHGCATSSECRRYEDAARLRDRINALERRRAHLHRLDRLRAGAMLHPRARRGARLRAGRSSSQRTHRRHAHASREGAARGRSRTRADEQPTSVTWPQRSSTSCC